nr:discoidin domain-containing protein [Sphingobium nicotianae]
MSFALVAASLLPQPMSAHARREAPRLIVDLTPAGQRAAFRPALAMGAAIDGAQAGDIDRLFTPHNIAAMKSLGLPSLTYRLRTELGIEVWHWNPAGTWSDPDRQQGYWTSDDRLGEPIGLSWGYKLPRRGDTVDNANNADYSRLTDGDPASFWKSNPYLDPVSLHDGRDHPQWLVVRLAGMTPLDTARIAWGEPYATRYKVQYWTAESEYNEKGEWRDFPHGDVDAGRGGEVQLSLSDAPIKAKFLRILMRQGSGTAPAGATNWRDKAGYAVREVSFGSIQPGGSFQDAVVHAADHLGQTFTHVSSTDPWHRAVDRDVDLEQVGIDRIFASGLGNGLPVLMPTGLLFDTPENMAAELRYLTRRGYPVTQVELGEEPDGQYGEAADYGALYLAAVDRLKAAAPQISFGGPSLQNAQTGNWMSPTGPTSWIGRFMAYLRERNRVSDLGFASFEYYPFDDMCGKIHAKLIDQDRMLAAAIAQFTTDGVPTTIPWIISEYGFSAYSGRAMSQMTGGLLMASIVGQWATDRGDPAFMFGYGPGNPVNQHLACAGYGEMTPFMADGQGQAAQPTAIFRTAQLLSQDWIAPGSGRHRAVGVKAEGFPGNEVRAYAVRRPDGHLALLIVNRSPDMPYDLPVFLRTGANRIVPLRAAVSIVQYGREQYQWLDQGPASHPARNLPPVRSRRAAGLAPISLPPESITVVITQ